MSLWSRIANVFRGDRLNRDIEEELQSHIAEAITEGRDPGEARRAFGSVLSHRERSALKGGSPHMRARMMQLLIAAQVAFCVLVVFVAGLFMATSDRLSRQHTGFAAERLLTVETVTPQPQPEPLWSQVADRLRTVPGVEAVAICEWPLMTGGSWNGFISVNGAAPGPAASYFLSVSPEWRALMKIPLLQGRDLRASDTLPGSALVNQAFARQYFGRGESGGKVV